MTRKRLNRISTTEELTQTDQHSKKEGVDWFVHALSLQFRSGLEVEPHRNLTRTGPAEIRSDRARDQSEV